MAEPPDRVDEMHRYLDAQADFIRALAAGGTVQFDWGSDGSPLKVRITKVDRVDRVDEGARGPRLSA